MRAIDKLAPACLVLLTLIGVGLLIASKWP